MKTRLILGCGYVGHRVGKRWLEMGDEVHTVTRSDARARILKDDGFTPWIQDLAEKWTLPAWPAFDSVLSAVGFDRKGPHQIRSVYLDGLVSAASRLRNSPRFVYISTTGVYGDSSGEWLDENSPCSPTREAGRVCLEAESWLEQHIADSHRVVLRAAGIYGPGRIPNLQAIKDGQPISAAPDSWLNLIHVDDLIEVIVWASDQSTPSPLYVVSDGSPVLRRDYYGYLSERCDLPAPVYSDPSAFHSDRQRKPTSKRIRSARLLSDSGIRLQYSSFRDGLNAVFDGSD